MKPVWQSKTIIFNLLYLALAVAAIFGWGDFQPEQSTVELGAVIVAIVNMYLRYVSRAQLTFKA